MMNYATNIALIDKATKLVTNVIWGLIYQEEEFNTETHQAVVIEDLAAQTGDSYDGANFYHEGQLVRSRAEEMAELTSALELLGVTE